MFRQYLFLRFFHIRRREQPFRKTAATIRLARIPVAESGSGRRVCLPSRSTCSFRRVRLQYAPPAVYAHSGNTRIGFFAFHA
ncbi:hypothetical protein KCP74_18305 [Salmonella enterica subsp. enterica]|nr:hypothetical protein KCP74_18305 [Salmonella enterica subsp. enterica]